MVKVIGNYLLRVLIFLLLAASLDKMIDAEAHIFIVIGFLINWINGFLPENISPVDDNSGMCFGFLIGLFFVFMTVFLFGTLTTYYFAKICGIFKKLDPLKKRQTFLIILLLSILCCLFHGSLNKFKYFSSYRTTANTLIPAYFLYLLLNHLTRKYPKYFEKIRYYSSIDFFKDLAVKIHKKVKKEEI